MSLTAFFVVAMIVSVFFLQKFALNVGEASIGLPLFTTWGLVGLAALFGVAHVDLARLGWFAAFAITAAVTQTMALVLDGEAFSVTSLGLTLLLYAIFIFRFRLTEADVRIAMNTISWVGVVAAVLVVLQLALQFALGSGDYMPKLDPLIPDALEQRGYIYLQRIVWDSPYFKPNGFFFLEPPTVSQVLGFAIVVEVVFFFRLWRLALMAAALLGTFAGTGVLLLAMMAPILAIRLPPRLLILAALAGVCVLAVGVSTGWLENLLSRQSELDQEGSSGYVRFVRPFEEMWRIINSPEALWGVGAGQMPEGKHMLWIPMAKVLGEYGVVTFLVFHAFLLYCLFDKTISGRVAIAMLIVYSLLGGSFAMPYSVMLAYAAVGALARPERQGLAPIRPVLAR
jgi:hypothetical protein